MIKTSSSQQNQEEQEEKRTAQHRHFIKYTAGDLQ
jgi:hypothetical protein